MSSTSQPPPLGVDSHPDIHEGAALFKGTDIPILKVGEMLSQGMTYGEVMRAHPNLSEAHVAFAEDFTEMFLPLHSRLADMPPIED